VWLVNEFVELARAARPWADRVRRETLPSGTDSINVPRIVTGTAVAEQATQNTAVQNTDATTGSVTANVATLAGQQVVALQLIEQSPINMDDLLLADLAADYAVKVDRFALTNNATGKKGILIRRRHRGHLHRRQPDRRRAVPEDHGRGAADPWGPGSCPPTRSSCTPAGGRGCSPPSTPRQRPLVVPNAQGPTNAARHHERGHRSGRRRLASAASTVVLDASLPTNLGAGTNEDVIVVAAPQDSVLWEGTPRAEAFRETKADQLSVLLRFYNYAGTGLVAPTF
jgi:hypothetical protein